MKIIEWSIRIENDFVAIELSPSFKKELNRQLTEILKPFLSKYIIDVTHTYLVGYCF